MQEQHLAVVTADGEMETFAAWPDGPGPFPVVVIYMDAPGIREELRGFARRVADRGYYCALPDLYYRRGRVRLDRATMDEAARKQMFAHMRSLSNAGVIADTAALLEALGGQPAAAPGPKGCIGYCMSGQFVMSVAGSFPEFRASVSCYGVGIVTDEPDTPHRLAPNVEGEMLFAFAETDEWVPDSDIETLRKTLDEHGVDAAVEIYPGTGHGFCFPERDAYVEDAAEDVWRRSFELFERRL
jgi:carboxymethylenebutenolidase